MNKRRRLEIFYRIAIFALLTLSAMLATASFFYDRALSYFIIPAAGALIAFILFNYLLTIRNMHKYIAEVDHKINLLERQSLYDLPVPALVADEERQILWYNGRCRTEVLDMLEAYGMSLNTVTERSLSELCDPDGVVIAYNGRVFRVFARSSPHEDAADLYILYFLDITEHTALKTEYALSRPVVAIILIDNYEELLQNVKESEKAHISSKLELLLENFIDQTTGILRKLSSNRFIAILEERHLQKMIETRFAILDKARSVMVTERMGVTLSIGIGRGAKTVEESEELAKQGLDMALGRGGDQVAIKSESGFEFFGGVSKGIEKQTKVKTRIIATALSELIGNSERVFVMGHRFGDLDSLGSAIGLVSVIRKMGKEAYIAVDTAKNLASALIKRMADKGQGDLFMHPETAVELAGRGTLLIIVDTHNPHFLESPLLYKQCGQVVIIDHHRKMVGHIDNAVIFHHEPFASSASEMVAELLQYFGDHGRVSALEAEALMAGIMLDTKNFVMRTGVRTFEAAAFLRKLGADTVAVRELFSSSIDSYQKKMRLVSSAEIYRRCAVANADFTAPELQIVAPQAADELLGISGVDASFVLYELDNVINISARSMGKLNVQLIMEALGGGGHLTMAGAQIKDATAESVRQMLLEGIDNYYESKRE